MMVVGLSRCRIAVVMTPFRPVDLNTPTLLANAVRAYVPAEHLARLMMKVVVELDPTALEATYWESHIRKRVVGVRRVRPISRLRAGRWRLRCIQPPSVCRRWHRVHAATPRVTTAMPAPRWLS